MAQTPDILMELVQAEPYRYKNNPSIISKLKQIFFYEFIINVRFSRCSNLWKDEEALAIVER